LKGNVLREDQMLDEKISVKRQHALGLAFQDTETALDKAK
jgi:hypothetical protein